MADRYRVQVETDSRIQAEALAELLQSKPLIDEVLIIPLEDSDDEPDLMMLKEQAE